jgi:TIR domain
VSSESQKVFICYRREETAAYAGRLYDAMVTRFGESNVFMDVDIAPGVDFVERITEVVSGCLVLIVVMGPHWATVTDEDGSPRIADPDDFVRLEVETGLKRPDVTPIPVLVSGARMPKREALPEPLRPLTRRNALDLSDARWAYDVGRLNSTLDVLLDETPEPSQRGSDPYPTPMPLSPPTPTPTPATPAAGLPAPAPDTASASASADLNLRLVLEGMAVAGIAAVVGRLLAGAINLSESSDAYKAAEVVLRRGVTWGLVGVALAVWLATRTRRTDLARVGFRGLVVGILAGAIGGAIWAARVYLPEPNLGTQSSEANAIQIVALAVTCGLVGALIGGLWRPPRGGIGLVGGVVAGALLQLVINGLSWNTADQPGNALNFGLAAVVVSGVVLTALLTLDRQESSAAPATLGAAEP